MSSALTATNHKIPFNALSYDKFEDEFSVTSNLKSIMKTGFDAYKELRDFI